MKKLLLLTSIFLLTASVAHGAMVVNSSGVSNNLKNGLVGWWTFDGGDTLKGASTLFRDVSGSGNNATTTAANPITVGKIAQGMAGNGVSNHTLAYNTGGVGAELDTAGDRTVSVWVKPKAFINGTTILHFTSYDVYIDTSGNPVWRIYNGTAFKTITATYPLPLNKWTHIAGVATGGTMRIFVNGIEKNSSTGNGNLASGYGPNLGIGTPNTLSSTYFLNGDVDDVRIYTRPLSANEVYSLYQYGNAKININSAGVAKDKLTNGLVGWWTFDGGDRTATSIFDKSGNGYHAAVSATGAIGKSGKIGQGMKIIGTADAVETTQTSFGTGSAFTISNWVRTDVSLGASQIMHLVGRDEVVARTWQWYIRSSDGSDSAVGLIRFNAAAGVIETVNAVGMKWRDKKWHHYVATFDTTNGVRIYEDGVQKTTTGGGSVTVNNDGAAVCLGCDPRTNSSAYSGELDDVRLYSRALSANEVYSLYQYGNAKINVSSQAVANQGTKSGLVGHWTFNGADCGATWCVDKSGNGNTGTITYFTKRNGKIGQGLYNNNITGAHIRINDDSDISGLGKVSFGGWVKGSDKSDYNYIMTKWQSPATNNEYHLRADITAGTPYCTTSTSGNYDATRDTVGVTNIVDGKWHHVMCVYDGTAETTRIYVDGRQDNTTLTGKGGTLTDGNLPLSIGDLSDASNPARAWNGTLDDMRVYNTALSANEIYSLYMYGK